MAEYGSIYPKEQKCLPFWAKVAIWLAVLAACAAGIAYFFTQGMVDTAREQLDALKNGNFPRAYYEFTSRDFQASTTLDDFQNFIRSQPSLYANKSASFSDRTIQNDLGSLHGTLVADDQTITPIEYQFVKEGGRWKILTMRLVPTGMLASNGPISTRVPESLERPVEQFFSALRDEDVARAYFGSTSKAFQNTTSLKTFREFIGQHPELTQYEKLLFGKQTVNPPKGTITLTVSSKKAPLTVECQLVKEDERWKIWNLKVEVPPPSQSVAVVDQDKEAIKQLIDSQLAHLRAGEISRAYYDETSGDFKDTTSLAAFKDYISQYPDLTEEKNFTTGEPEIRGDKATLKGYLGSDPEKGTKIAFQLSREKGLWKIWGFQVEPQPVANETIPEFSAEELADLIQNQLDAIRSEDISKAYYVYTSSAFRKYTPLNKFEEFVQDHPIFQHNQMINFTNLAFKDGVGSFDGNLVGVDNQSVPVTYELVFEDGRWKILGIQVSGGTSKIANPSNTTDKKGTKPQANRPPQKNKQPKEAPHDSLSASNATPIPSYNRSYNTEVADRGDSPIRPTELPSSKTNNQISTDSDRGTRQTVSRYRPSNQTIPSVATRKPLSEETHSTLPTEPASDSKQPSSEAPQIDHEPTIQIQNSDQTPSSPPTHPDEQPQSFQQPAPQYYSGTKSSPKARIYVNSGTDKNGRISKSLSQFPTNQPELYVDLVIDNGEPGEVTQLTLQHLNSGGAVSAQDQMVAKRGRSVFSYVFKAPNGGWPEGEYRIIGAGQARNAVVEFQVR